MIYQAVPVSSCQQSRRGRQWLMHFVFNKSCWDTCVSDDIWEGIEPFHKSHHLRSFFFIEIMSGIRKYKGNQKQRKINCDYDCKHSGSVLWIWLENAFHPALWLIFGDSGRNPCLGICAEAWRSRTSRVGTCGFEDVCATNADKLSWVEDLITSSVNELSINKMGLLNFCDF